MNEIIKSRQNNRVKFWCSLKNKKYRNKEKLFLIEGNHLLEEANKIGIVESVIAVEGSTFSANYYVSKEVMEKISSNVSVPDVVAVCRFLDTNKGESNKVVMLDNLQDPGNIGTIIRTAKSFGYDEVIIDEGVDIYNEKLIRATQGAIFHINVRSSLLTKEIIDYQNEGFKVYATSLKNSKPLKSYGNEERIAIVFGNEGNGVRPDILDIVDSSIFIEINGFESLNVAVAAGIVLHYFS